MHPLLKELLTNAENKIHVIEFIVDISGKQIQLVAPFDLQVIGDRGRAIVEANNRVEAVKIVRNSGIPIKRFIELH